MSTKLCYATQNVKQARKIHVQQYFLYPSQRTFIKQTRESQIQNLQRKIVTLGLLCMEFITEVVFSVRKGFEPGKRFLG